MAQPEIDRSGKPCFQSDIALCNKGNVRTMRGFQDGEIGEEAFTVGTSAVCSAVIYFPSYISVKAFLMGVHLVLDAPMVYTPQEAELAPTTNGHNGNVRRQGRAARQRVEPVLSSASRQYLPTKP